MSRRSVDLLLAEIAEAIEKIERYVSGLDHDKFFQDDKTVDAVVRNLGIVGEAAGRLPVEFKASHPEVECGRTVALRNRIIDDYFGVDLDIVWAIIGQELPGLKARVRELREGLPKRR